MIHRESLWVRDSRWNTWEWLRCYVYPSRAPESPARRWHGKSTWPQKTRTWYCTWQSWDGRSDKGHGKLLYGAWRRRWRSGADDWTIGMLIEAGHLSDVAWLWLLSGWCDWTLGVLSLLSGHVFDASWLCVPEGGSYLGSWRFTLYMVLINPCGFDGWLLLVDKTCVSCLSSVWIRFPLLYILVHLYSIFPSLDILIST